MAVQGRRETTPEMAVRAESLRRLLEAAWRESGRTVEAISRDARHSSRAVEALLRGPARNPSYFLVVDLARVLGVDPSVEEEVAVDAQPRPRV